MKQLVVGTGGCAVTGDREAVLATYALGSCIAVAIHDPAAGVAGMLHFMLPESSLDTTKAAANPYLFADTGIPQLFRRAYELGAEKHRLRVGIAGGAQMVDGHGVFNIGKRNCLAARKILWKAGVLVQQEHVGGNTSRTLRLEVASGRMLLFLGGELERTARVAPSTQGVAEWNTAY